MGVLGKGSGLRWKGLKDDAGRYVFHVQAMEWLNPQRMRTKGHEARFEKGARSRIP